MPGTAEEVTTAAPSRAVTVNCSTTSSNAAYSRPHHIGTVGGVRGVIVRRTRVETERRRRLLPWWSGSMEGRAVAAWEGCWREHGPFLLRPNKERHGDNPHPFRLDYNRYSWSTDADVLYVDQPVGVGFSHLHRTADLVHNEGQVAEDFYQALTYFLTHQHPEYRHRRVYLSGESYAAKYVPAIAAYILRQNRCLHHHEEDDEHFQHYASTFRSLHLPMSCPDERSPSAPSLHVNLSGLFIGNGDYSPMLQRFASRPILLSLGLRDVKQANQYSYLEEVSPALHNPAAMREALWNPSTHPTCVVC